MNTLFLRAIILIITAFQHINCLDFAQSDAKSLNKCDQCKTVVDSFKEGLKRTARGKHEGGDAHWEESKLKNYAFSEIRFVDIQDHLCHDSATKDQCYSFAEEYESDIEDWFMNGFKEEKNKGSEGSTLFQHLCFDISKSCCKDGHFGPNCELCTSYPDNVCHSRGTCDGSGTRSGTGKCQCFPGYAGKYCHKCAKNYLSVGETDSNFNNDTVKIPEKCLKCDSSCQDSCTALGPKGCSVCAKGFQWDEEYGCADLDECKNFQVNPCSEQKYCVNTIGSYECYRCNSACSKCFASGPDSCIECSENYRRIGNTCFKLDDSLPNIVFIIPIVLGLVIFKFFNFWYSGSFLVVYALAIKVFEEHIMNIL